MIDARLVDELYRASQPPPLFEPGEPLFWDDPHISRQMLAAHLNPEVEAASRPPGAIDRIVRWLMSYLDLSAGDTLLDLGCGPGLYSARFAERGVRVTGIDVSRRSLAYAEEYAAANGLAITYRREDFRSLDEVEQYNAVIQIYGELCVFAPAVRDDLLDRIWRALKPGGALVFDVTTRAHRRRTGRQNGWYAAESGFWRPGPHMVLEQGFDYPEHDTYLDQYAVIDAERGLTIYRNWFLDYSLESISAVLAGQGFTVRAAWGDLAGAPLGTDSEWIGVAAGKPAQDGV